MKTKSKIVEKIDENNSFIPPSRDEIKDMVNRSSCEEIFTQTHPPAWNDVYLDTGIEKGVFMTTLYVNWREYWSEKIKDFKYEKMGQQEMQQSWREVQLLGSIYDDIASPLEFAQEVDDFTLYPLCVLSMLEIFDLDSCLDEYMEYMEDVEY